MKTNKTINIIIIAIIVFFTNICFWWTITNQNNIYKMYQLGYNKYQNKDYNWAIEILKPISESCNNQEICINIKELLKYCYVEVWNSYFDQKDPKNAAKSYQEALKLDPQDPITLMNLGSAYLIWDQLEKALMYYKKAKEYLMESDALQYIENNIKYIEGTLETQNRIWSKTFRSHTNDWLNKYQYYLETINVYNAWKKLPTKTNTVTIAVIDDGVYIKHPDLKEIIWHNPWEIQWNWIDDDHNWYVDDYYGWNFEKNNTKLAPITSHGTTIAGVIWATTNNWQRIAWISPNVEIIPLAVFSTWWYAKDTDIIAAIEYAINKWANIINLSLWSDSTQDFLYNPWYDNVIKKAYDRGIVIVIAAWNWKKITETESIWINTSTDKISPVCNEWKNKKTIIWVWALNVDWEIANRSNYWDCVDFYAPWENIASIWLEKEFFQIVNWTSLSAPIIAGIIALWYNKYGAIDPDIVYDTLTKSKKLNTIDASLYLQNLEEYFNSIWLNELRIAINRMYERWLTIYNTPDTFMYKNGLRRDEATKFFVKYAKDILWIRPDTNKVWCEFTDLDKAWPDLKELIVESCQLWLFQWYQWKFMPEQQLTNAQALAVFIRMIDWWKDESDGHFADNYLRKAQELWIVEWLSLNIRSLFDVPTTRWDVALMIYRASQKQ